MTGGFGYRVVVTTVLSLDTMDRSAMLKPTDESSARLPNSLYPSEASLGLETMDDSVAVLSEMLGPSYAPRMSRVISS